MARRWVSGAAVAVALALAFVAAGCGGEEESAGPYTLTNVPAGGEPCASEPRPTAELDEIRDRLLAAGYDAEYGAHSALGFFTDEEETAELCADAALAVSGNGLGRFDRVDVRQLADPATFEEMAAELETFPETSLVVDQPLLYFSTAAKRELDRVVDAAAG